MIQRLSNNCSDVCSRQKSFIYPLNVPISQTAKSLINCKWFKSAEIYGCDCKEVWRFLILKSNENDSPFHCQQKLSSLYVTLRFCYRRLRNISKFESTRSISWCSGKDSEAKGKASNYKEWNISELKFKSDSYQWEYCGDKRALRNPGLN